MLDKSATCFNYEPFLGCRKVELLFSPAPFLIFQKKNSSFENKTVTSVNFLSVCDSQNFKIIMYCTSAHAGSISFGSYTTLEYVITTKGATKTKTLTHVIFKVISGNSNKL